MKFIFVCKFRIGNILIEFIIIFWSDFILASYPNSWHNILSFSIHNNWIINKIWISLNSFKYFSFLTENSLIWFKMYSYFSSSTLEIIFGFWNFKCSCSIWYPNISLIWSFTFTHYFYSISNNKWRIKSNTKLTNNFIIHLCTHLF